ncbi:Cell morphoproteinis protein [Salix suchowensis]|nr:Cell morphoproteinis protein [Salix suchowensis]
MVSDGMQITIPDFDDNEYGSAPIPFGRSANTFGGGGGGGLGLSASSFSASAFGSSGSGQDSPTITTPLADRWDKSHGRGDSVASFISIHEEALIRIHSQCFQKQRKDIDLGYSPPVPQFDLQAYPVLKNPFNRSNSSLNQRQAAVSPPYSETPDMDDDKIVMDPKTPSDYALHAVFMRFASVAESKISTFLRNTAEDPSLPATLAVGIDPKFDDTLQSLAKIAQRNCKPVVDSIMRWRKSQQQEPALASIYIVCRALIAVLQAASKEALGDALGYSLEDTTFEQFRRPDLKLLAQSANHRANAELYSTLIGLLANIRFVSVTDRFLSELGPVASGQVPKDSDMKYENLLQGLRHVTIKVWPPETFEEGAEFLESLSKSFANAHGLRLKIAFAETLLHLIHPIGKTAQAETNNPQWAKAIEIIYPKAKEMVSKPRYWHVAYPLLVTSLCVAPQAFFLKNWLPCFESGLSKLKESAVKSIQHSGSTASVLAPERTAIAVQAILLTLHRMESDEHFPSWPTSADFSIIPTKADYPSSSDFLPPAIMSRPGVRSCSTDMLPVVAAVPTTTIPLADAVDILLRGVVHVEPSLGDVAREAVKRFMAEPAQAMVVLSRFAVLMFSPTGFLQENNGPRLPIEASRFLQLWIELVDGWVKTLTKQPRTSLNDDEIQRCSEIEAGGLFLLATRIPGFTPPASLFYVF